MAILTPVPALLPAFPGPPGSAAERDALVERLDSGEGWALAAASLLAELGFRLVPPDEPERQSWHLLIALRDRPSLRHFDPEAVTYYAPTADGAAPVTLDRFECSRIRERADRPTLWGHVHVVDRLPVENRFLTFGGRLRIEAVTPQLTVLDLASPAPIVRWGGHSQGTDDLAEAIGAFFGRLIVPIDFVPGAARRIDAVPADVLYRAFLADALRRRGAAGRRGAGRDGLGAWIVHAWRRARADSSACDAAQRLLRDLEAKQRAT
jgi:hypothetical protein